MGDVQVACDSTAGSSSARAGEPASAGRGGHSAAVTAWPPNWLRIAAIIFIAGLSSWRETNRANSEAVIAGSGTALSMAASTVHRPSPESSA